MKNYVRHICYNKKQIDILGEVSLRVSSAGWVVEECKFLVVENACCLLGLDFQAALGIETHQRQNPNRTNTTNSKNSPSLVNSTELAKTDEWVSNNWKN